MQRAAIHLRAIVRFFRNDRADLKLFRTNFNQLLKKRLPPEDEKFIEIMVLYAYSSRVGHFISDSLRLCMRELVCI